MSTRITTILLVLLGGCAGAGGSSEPPGSECVDFQSLAPRTFAGPGFTIPPLAFINPTQSGAARALTLEDRVEDRDGRPELYLASSRSTGAFQPLIVEFPRSAFPDGVNAVYVTLRHSASAGVTAKDASGGVLTTASVSTPLTRGVLSLQGRGIARLEFEATETLLYRICWR